MASQYQGERLASRLRQLRDRSIEGRASIASIEKHAEEILSPEEQGMVHSASLLFHEIENMMHRVQKQLTARKCMPHNYVEPALPPKTNEIGGVVT